MEISSRITDPLRYLSSLDKEKFSQLVDNVFLGLCDQAVPAMNEPLDKILLSSLMAVVVESYSQNVGTAYVSTFLEEKGMTADQKVIFKQKFDEYFDQVKLQLKSLAPQREASVVDVQWKLNYLNKSSGMEKEEELSYLIKLVARPDENGDSETTKEIDFTCSLHQLQDLAAGVREAWKRVEKLSSVTDL